MNLFIKIVKKAATNITQTTPTSWTRLPVIGNFKNRNNSMSEFFENYWQWLIGTIVAVLSILIAFLQYKKKQQSTNKLSSGSNSINLQNSPNSSIGLTYTESKDLFIDLLELNFPRFREIAAEEASKNIERLSVKFADRINAKSLSIGEEISTADFQFCLYKAIETGARFKDDTLQNFLAELLVSRASSGKDGSLTAILNESILTIGKITTNQLKLMTFSFLFFDYCYKLPLKTWDEFNCYINEYVFPFMDYSYKNIDILHLDYCGCINNGGAFKPSLSKIIKNRIPELYPDLKSGSSEQTYIDGVTKSELVHGVDFFKMIDKTNLWAIEPTSVGLMLIKVYFEIERGYKLEDIDKYFN